MKSLAIFVGILALLAATCFIYGGRKGAVKPAPSEIQKSTTNNKLHVKGLVRTF